MLCIELIALNNVWVHFGTMRCIPVSLCITSHCQVVAVLCKQSITRTLCGTEIVLAEELAANNTKSCRMSWRPQFCRSIQIRQGESLFRTHHPCPCPTTPRSKAWSSKKILSEIFRSLTPLFTACNMTQLCWCSTLRGGVSLCMVLCLQYTLEHGHVLLCDINAGNPLQVHACSTRTHKTHNCGGK